jgi:hypothetical protein
VASICHPQPPSQFPRLLCRAVAVPASSAAPSWFSFSLAGCGSELLCRPHLIHRPPAACCVFHLLPAAPYCALPQPPPTLPAAPGFCALLHLCSCCLLHAATAARRKGCGTGSCLPAARRKGCRTRSAPSISVSSVASADLDLRRSCFCAGRCHCGQSHQDSSRCPTRLPRPGPPPTRTRAAVSCGSSGLFGFRSPVPCFSLNSV